MRTASTQLLEHGEAIGRLTTRITSGVLDRLATGELRPEQLGAD